MGAAWAGTREAKLSGEDVAGMTASLHECMGNGGHVCRALGPLSVHDHTRCFTSSCILPLPSRSPGTYLSGKVSPILHSQRPLYVGPWSLFLTFLFLRMARRPPASRTAPSGLWRARSSLCRELSTRPGAGRVATCSSDAGKRQFSGCWPSRMTTDEYRCMWMYTGVDVYRCAYGSMSSQ